ncbi:TPA: hypothetical protein HA259_06895 [Thermoplasmata archaeon]|nr:hypothetical protein [Thermoplasmata archaeon]
MPENVDAFDRYPVRTVLLSNLSVVAVWAIGAYLLWVALGVIGAVAFIIYCAVLEVNLLKKSCVNCYYYGRTCFSGRGRVCARLFKSGDPARFTAREISWKDIVPDLAVSFVPLICGIGLIVVDFSWLIVVLVLALLALSTAGNALIRGRLACKHCRQRLLGCPAEKLFSSRSAESG